MSVHSREANPCCIFQNCGINAAISWRVKFYKNPEIAQQLWNMMDAFEKDLRQNQRPAGIFQ